MCASVDLVLTLATLVGACGFAWMCFRAPPTRKRK